MELVALEVIAAPLRVIVVLLAAANVPTTRGLACLSTRQPSGKVAVADVPMLEKSCEYGVLVGIGIVVPMGVTLVVLQPVGQPPQPQAPPQSLLVSPSATSRTLL
jgi:hypothetical protein